jgi:hypothetical protein
LDLLVGGTVFEGAQKLLEGGAVLGGGQEGGFFVAGGVDREEVLGREGGGEDCLAEVEGDSSGAGN